jgi:hypothetical protein
VTKRTQLNPYTRYPIELPLYDIDSVRSDVLEALGRLKPNSVERERFDDIAAGYIALVHEHVKESLAEPQTRAEVDSQLTYVRANAESLADALARLGEPAAQALSAALSRGQPEHGAGPLTIAQIAEVARRLADAASSPVIT